MSHVGLTRLVLLFWATAGCDGYIRVSAETGHRGAKPGDAGGRDDDTGGDAPWDHDGSVADASIEDAATPVDMAEPPFTCVRSVTVEDGSELEAALDDAEPGDCIELADGTYTFPELAVHGTETLPVVVRAANTLGVSVERGDIAIRGAAHVVVEGVHFTSSGRITMADCDHCRVSRFRIERAEDGDEVDWVTVSGASQHCRIDHNDFGPQRAIGNMVMLSGEGGQVVQHTRIDHNHFHDVEYAGGNGWEIIRAGLSGYTFSSGFTIIEHNLFERAHSDPETISVKSSDNVIRYNTMRDTAGQFTLRHGNRTEVYGNYILGDGREGSAGIRIYGGEHRIYNNYIAGVEGTAILVDGGNSDDESGELTDHKVSYDVQVLFNTIVSQRGISVGSSKPLKPRDCVVAYNLLAGDGILLHEQNGTAYGTWRGNLVHEGSSDVDDGVIEADPGFEQNGDIYEIGPDSPAVDAAETTYEIDEDIAGRTRSMPDIGAQEVSGSAARYRMLEADDVGPLAP
jgi:poly(beta-D-mannuronate) lyase